MSWIVRVSTHAEKYYLRLDKRLRSRIREELESLASLSNPCDHPRVKPLTGMLHGFNRLRVGDYRVVFALMVKEQIIAVVNIAPRGDVYKKKQRN